MHIGTAGWSISRQVADRFTGSGSSLERYASRFNVTEINSSFHRPHRVSTWERWRDSVPPTFRFSVKIPKTITHEAKLRDCSRLVGEFMEQARILGDALAVLLVQLPPKLEFEPRQAKSFFLDLKSRSAAEVACEPRNSSWFTPDVTAQLAELGIARVAADPAISAAAAVPGAWPGLRYWRLHGTPLLYRSSYADRIPSYAARLLEYAADGNETWCIFDNTASSAASSDALLLAEAVRQAS